MSRQVLGKRSRSSFSSSPSPSPSPSPTPVPRRVTRASVALALPSPDPTPKSKRVKTSSTELEEFDGSNKENIPPEPILGASNLSDDLRDPSPDAFTSTTTLTARELRLSRRASTTSTRSTQTARRRTSSSRAQSPTTSSDHISGLPPVSQITYKPRAGAETPSKAIARLSLVTPPSTPASMPSPPSCTDNVISTRPASLHSTLRASLRPQANGSTPLVGREHERQQILNFLTPFIAGDSECVNVTSLYVSGAPGTGKTALVSEVLDTVALQGADMDVNNVPLRVLYLNCMSLSLKDGMAGVWERCLEHFSNEKAKKRVTATKVDWSERFGRLLRGQKCILVLDEIDHLAASTSSLSISEIFSLTADPLIRSSLRVIGISNTHTLTHAKPTPHCQTIHFQPYTSAQMKLILGKRLESLSASDIDSSKVFPPSTIALLAFKIANETGDIRTVFSVAKRALDLATVGSSASSVTVTPAHVLAALKASNAAMNTSQSKRHGAETVTRVRNLGLHSRFALAALLLAAKRITAGLSLSGSGPNTSSGSFKENAQPSKPSSQGRDTAQPAIEMTALHGFYVAILSRGDYGAFLGVGRTEFGDLIGLLEGSGLVELAQGRGFGSKTKSPTKGKGAQTVCVSCGVREEELVRGLVGSPSSAGTEDAVVNVSEEEVKNIWEREIRRLDREVKARFGNAVKHKADFDDAEED